MTPLDDCDYVCRECGLVTCRDERPSPMEDERVCDDCAHLADGLRDWGGGGDAA